MIKILLPRAAHGTAHLTHPTFFSSLQMLLPRELSAVDTCCKAFHPISLTEKAGMIVAGWFLKKQSWSFRGGEGVGQWVDRMIYKSKRGRGGRIAAGGRVKAAWVLMINDDGQLVSLGCDFHGHGEGHGKIDIAFGDVKVHAFTEEGGPH